MTHTQPHPIIGLQQVCQKEHQEYVPQIGQCLENYLNALLLEAKHLASVSTGRCTRSTQCLWRRRCWTACRWRGRHFISNIVLLGGYSSKQYIYRVLLFEKHRWNKFHLEILMPGCWCITSCRPSQMATNSLSITGPILFILAGSTNVLFWGKYKILYIS